MLMETMELEGVSAETVKGCGRAVKRKLKNVEMRKKSEEMM